MSNDFDDDFYQSPEYIFLREERLMTEQLYGCYLCGDPWEVQPYSKQEGRPICDDCYIDRYWDSYYERKNNPQYGED